MAKSDLFRRSLEAGTTFVDLSRERAEAVVKEWVEAGDLGRGKAKKAVEDLLERSHRVTDELRAMIRREIGEQVAALGLATRDDLARVEAKVDAVAASGAQPASAATPRRRAATAAPRRRAPASATSAKATPTATTAEPAPRAPRAGASPKPAGRATAPPGGAGPGGGAAP